MSTSEYPFLLRHGKHSDKTESCLMEASSPSHNDHDPNICVSRAAFARRLNDSYPQTTEGDVERTTDLWPLITGLRDTAAREDSREVYTWLVDRALHDWFPRSLEPCAQILRESGDPDTIGCVDILSDVIVKLRGTDLTDHADRAKLAALIDRAEVIAHVEFAKFANRADLINLLAGLAKLANLVAVVLVALADLGKLVNLVARADLIRADFVVRVDLAARVALSALEGRVLRSEMAAALMETCAPGWVDFQPVLTVSLKGLNPR